MDTKTLISFEERAVNHRNEPSEIIDKKIKMKNLSVLK